LILAKKKLFPWIFLKYFKIPGEINENEYLLMAASASKYISASIVFKEFV